MLKAIKEAGQYIRESKNSDDVQILTESSKLSNTKKIICVVFMKKNNNLIFDRVYIEDFDREKATKILYRTFGHAQYDATLTARVPNKKEEKKIVFDSRKLEKRWRLWFNRYIEKFEKDDEASYYEVVTFLRNLKNSIEENKDEIFGEISKKYDQLNNQEKRRCLITIKIKDDENEKYPADIPEFIKIFRTVSMEDFYYKHKVESRGKGTCCLCFQQKMVFPASPFFVFTVDKVGFAYEFNRANSWKQLPICFDCALDLQVGKEFLKKQLSFKLYGYQYFVIPSAIQKETLNEIIREIELYARGDDYRRGLINAEEDILEMLKEKMDVFAIIFIFYKTKGKDDFFDILRYVEDVPPSWIKKIYDIFRSISQKSVYKEDKLKNVLGEKWSGDFREGKSMWNGKPVSRLNLAGMIGEFFYHREENRKVFDKSSLDILGNILESKQIDKEYLIKHLIESIREEHNRGNEWNEKLLSLKSLYLLNFLIELGLISSDHFVNKKVKEVEFMEEIKIKDSEKVETFFSEFSRTFDTPDKRVVFLEGVLVSFLLDIQYAKRKDTPFRKKLHGLRLNRRVIKKLFPETIEKLRQYDAGYPWLEALISKYFIEADENGWTISDDEISYYFTLGLNLGKIFKGGEQNE